MKTMKSLANMMLMSIAAAATVSFTACSDDVIENEKQGAATVKASETDRLLEPIGLMYTDFIKRTTSPSSTTILPRSALARPTPTRWASPTS